MQYCLARLTEAHPMTGLMVSCIGACQRGSSVEMTRPISYAIAMVMCTVVASANARKDVDVRCHFNLSVILFVFLTYMLSVCQNACLVSAFCNDCNDSHLPKSARTCVRIHTWCSYDTGLSKQEGSSRDIAFFMLWLVSVLRSGMQAPEGYFQV